MLNNSFRYYQTESCIHLLNPLCKILISFIFVVMVLFSFSFKSVVALSIILSFIIGLSNIPCKNIFKPIWCIKYVIFFMFLFSLPFGIYNSLVFVFKLLIITVYYSIFIMSTKVNDLVKGFFVLYSPLKLFGVQIDKLSINSALFLNFIPFYVQEFISKEFFLRSRGFEHSFKNDFCLMINTIFVTYKNILKKRDIMVIRGIVTYDGNFVWKVSDVYIVMCHIVVLVLVLVKEVVV